MNTLSFQFGNTYQRRAPGFVLLSGVYTSPCYLWVGNVNGFQTWSGMRMEATGFAGMTLAEMIKPGVLYLGSFAR